MKKKYNISVVLMVTAIIVIAAFQIYWLIQQIEEQKRVLHVRSTVIFREAVFELQANKLRLSQNSNGFYESPNSVLGFSNMIHSKLKDSNNVLDKASKAKYVELIKSIDDIQDPLTTKEVTDLYTANLAKENINVPFTIIRKELDKPYATKPPWTVVPVGFKKPVSFEIQLGSTTGYITKKLVPQVSFSLFLLAITITAFIVLYKNLKAQHKLSAIKDEFMSNVTHELKTPIATVSVAIEAIKNFNILNQPQKTQEYLVIAENELQRLSLHVDRVLKLSMFEQERTTLNWEEFNVMDLIEDVVSSMRLHLEKSDAKLNIYKTGNNFEIKADYLHMSSVLFNLLDNALKYKRVTPEISITVEDSEQELLISVKDNGLGIPAEHKERVFDKFFRVPSGNTHNIKGYGLGLSYVAHIISLHKGAIAVNSENQIGSEFIIKLPRKYETN